MRKEIVRVGVVGLGMGRFHIQHYAKLPAAKVQAICDLDAELLKTTATEFSIPQTFVSFEDLLNNAEIDAVSLAVPNYLHKPMTIAALDRRLHVLCEKPMAMNTAEAVEMRDKVRATGRKFMVHFNQRFRAEHQYIKSLIQADKLGSVYYATAGWRRMRGIPRFGGWFGRKEMSGGGPLIDLGVHMLDLARWLIGNPKALTVSASTFSFIGQSLALAQKKHFDVEDLAAALIRFDNGTTLAIEASWALNFEEREKVYLELSGTRGGISSISYDYKDTQVSVFQEKNGAMVKTVPIKYPQNFESAQEHFINCILHDTEPSASADDGVEIMRLLDAIYESARIGREVEIRQVSQHN
jgi:predicted dehydrogenase